MLKAVCLKLTQDKKDNPVASFSHNDIPILSVSSSIRYSIGSYIVTFSEELIGEQTTIFSSIHASDVIGSIQSKRIDNMKIQVSTYDTGGTPVDIRGTIDILMLIP